MILKYKHQMYKLLHSGKLGNTFRFWKTWEEVVDSGYHGMMSIRSLTVDSPVREYDISFPRVEEIVKRNRGRNFIFYEATPNHTRVIQGEVCRSHRGLEFTYSFVKLPMKLAFEKEKKYVHGLAALHLMQAHIDPSSLQNIFDLLDDYEGHVVEFSTYRVNVGTLKCPTVIWEVRQY